MTNIFKECVICHSSTDIEIHYIKKVSYVIAKMTHIVIVSNN